METCVECRALVNPGEDMTYHLQYHAATLNAFELGDNNLRMLAKCIEDLGKSHADFATQTADTIRKVAIQIDQRFALMFSEIMTIKRFLS